jgi:hypothetical protein
MREEINIDVKGIIKIETLFMLINLEMKFTLKCFDHKGNSQITYYIRLHQSLTILCS